MHLLKQTVTMQTEVRVNYLNCHIHVPSKHVLVNREANSRHTYDVTIWLSRTTDNSNIFIRSREVRDNESRLYVPTQYFQIISNSMGVMACKDFGFRGHKYITKKVRGVSLARDMPIGLPNITKIFQTLRKLWHIQEFGLVICSGEITRKKNKARVVLPTCDTSAWQDRCPF